MKPRAPALGKQLRIGVFRRPFQGLGVLAALQPRVPLRSTLGSNPSPLLGAEPSQFFSYPEPATSE